MREDNLLQMIKRLPLMLGGGVRDYAGAFAKRHLPAMRLSGVAADLLVSYVINTAVCKPTYQSHYSYRPTKGSPRHSVLNLNYHQQ